MGEIGTGTAPKTPKTIHILSQICTFLVQIRCKFNEYFGLVKEVKEVMFKTRKNDNIRFERENLNMFKSILKYHILYTNKL